MADAPPAKVTFETTSDHVVTTTVHTSDARLGARTPAGDPCFGIIEIACVKARLLAEAAGQPVPETFMVTMVIEPFTNTKTASAPGAAT